MGSSPASIRTLDGLRLGATTDQPSGPSTRGVLLVHGAGVTREEGGFFARLAAGLAEAGVASVRLDLPGHGESEGRQENLTFAAVMNVIAVGLDQVRQLTGVTSVSLLAASFSGGASAYYAAKRPADVERLVLINPLIDYKRRFIEEKPVWATGSISDKGAAMLAEQGYVAHGSSFKLGRPLLNEVFWFTPRDALPEITAPTLVVHGTEDSFIPVDSSRRAVEALTCEHRYIELQGAQHGVAMPDDPQYVHPQTRAWQADIIQAVSEWVSGSK